MSENVASQKRGGLLVKVLLIYLAAVLLFGALSFTFSYFDVLRWEKNEFALGEQHNQPDREAFKNRWLPLYEEKGADGFAFENFVAETYGVEALEGESATAIVSKCQYILDLKESVRADNIRRHERNPKNVKLMNEDELLDEALKKAFPTKTELPVFPMLYRFLFQLVIGIACIVFMKMSSAQYNIGFSMTPKSYRSLLYVIPLLVFFVGYVFIKLTWAQSMAWLVILTISTAFVDLMVAATGVYLLRAVGAGRFLKMIVPTVAVILSHVISWVLMGIPAIGEEMYAMDALMEFPLFMPIMMMVLIVVPVLTFFGVVVYYKSHQIIPVFLTVCLVVIGMASMFAWTVYLLPAASYVTYGLFIAGLPICLVVGLVLFIHTLASKKPVDGDELCEYRALER